MSTPVVDPNAQLSTLASFVNTVFSPENINIFIWNAILAFFVMFGFWVASIVVSFVLVRAMPIMFYVRHAKRAAVISHFALIQDRNNNGIDDRLEAGLASDGGGDGGGNSSSSSIIKPVHSQQPIASPTTSK